MGLYRVIGNGTNTPLPTVTSNDKLTISLYATQMESKSGSVQLWVLDENFNDIDWSGNIMTYPDMKKLTVEISGNNLNNTQKYYIAVLMEVKDANYIWANRTQPRMELANFKIELEKLSYTQEEVSDTSHYMVRPSYAYSWNTQQRLDEVAGPGNHYTAKYWEYDSRTVFRWNTDPKPNPSFSPYSIMQGNPIMYSDFLGDSVRNKYQAGAKFEGLRQALRGKIENAETMEEKINARKEYRANKENFRLYDKYKEVDDLIEGFKAKNESEFDILNNLTFNGEDIDIIVGLKSGFSGKDGQVGETILSYSPEDIITVEDLKTGDHFKLPTSLQGNEIHVGLYRMGLRVSTLANEFGDALFGVENPRSSYEDRNLPYFQKGSTKFSFEYEDYIMKGGLRPNPLHF